MTRKRFIAPAVLGETTMKSLVIKRSIVVAGRKTSVGLEDAFWNGLKEIAKWRDQTLSNLIASINADRQHANLSSAIRLYVLAFYRDQREAGDALDPSIRPNVNGFHPSQPR
jgi:predicted DNA-binding ribbon-helix-helix protein